jgi:hypothetical protein
MGKPPFQATPGLVFNMPQHKQVPVAAFPPPALAAAPIAAVKIKREAPVVRRQATTSAAGSIASAAPTSTSSFSLTPLPTNGANPQNPAVHGSFLAVVVAVIAVGI